MDAADIGSPGPHHRAVHPLGRREPNSRITRPWAARTRRLALVAMRALVVDAQEGVGLDELGLSGGGPNGDEGLVGEYRRPLRTAQMSPVKRKVRR